MMVSICVLGLRLGFPDSFLVETVDYFWYTVYIRLTLALTRLNRVNDHSNTQY